MADDAIDLGRELARGRELVDGLHALMLESADEAGVRLQPDHWTLQEMAGHLVDSASNNHQRFVRLQLEAELVFPSYDQDAWRDVSGFMDMDFDGLVALWKGYNDFLLHIMAGIAPEHLPHVWCVNGNRYSLGFLVRDYFDHLVWHTDLWRKRLGEIRDAG